MDNQTVRGSATLVAVDAEYAKETVNGRPRRTKVTLGFTGPRVVSFDLDTTKQENMDALKSLFEAVVPTRG